MKIIAIVLLAFGLVGLTLGAVSYTTKEKVVDLGPIDITREKTTTQSIPLPVSIAAVALGGVLLFMGKRQMT